MSAADHVERPTQDAPLSVRSASGVSAKGLCLGPMLGVLFALLGAGVAWLVLLVIYPMFDLPPALANLSRSATAEQVRAHFAARKRVNQRNTMLAVAVVGLLVGGSLGIAEGVARRRLTTIPLGGTLAAIAGALFGMLGGFLGDHPILFAMPSLDPGSLIPPLVAQLVTLALLGTGVGLGLSAWAGGIRPAFAVVLAGTLAGVLSGFCYPLLVSFLMPLARTERPVPFSSDNQLVWLAMTAALLGLIIPTVCRKPLPDHPASAS